jgi:DNA-binding CsgD family transcriptional regulator
MARLVDQVQLPIIATSRERPRWVSAKKIIYGEIVEVTRSLLAMDDDEASAVLGHTRAEAETLYERADGWPALIGLAALTTPETLTKEALPKELHDFFAEELFQQVDPRLRESLCEFGIVPSLTADLARELRGADIGAAVVEEGLRVGFWTLDPPDGLAMHRLVRAFLLTKLADRSADDRRSALTPMVEVLISRRRWDDAFAVIESGRLSVEPLLEAGVPALLAEGRTATLERWLTLADSTTRSPIASLTAAELAFRRGDHSRAESLALHAAASLADRHPAKSRAYLLAGKSAALAGRDQDALRAHRHAFAFAHTESESRDAVIGQLYASLDLDQKGGDDLLNALLELPSSTPEAQLRTGSARIMYASRRGQLSATIVGARPVLEVVSEADDPMAASAFLHVYASAASLNAQYDEALEVSDTLLELARHYRLDFVLPHAWHTRAQAFAGIRNFKASRECLKASVALADAHNDYVCLANSESLAARLAAQGRLPRRPTIDFPFPGLSIGVESEFFASQAMLAASQGDLPLARSLASRALAITEAPETTTLVHCVFAVVATLEAAREGAECSRRALETSNESGYFDFFVCAYRALPDLLRMRTWSEAEAHQISSLLAQSRDDAIARLVGLSDTAAQGAESLSPRERDVASLLIRGHTNRAIAAALYISEATAKLHVRHIFDKLGVRSRTKVAILLANEFESGDESA